MKKKLILALAMMGTSPFLQTLSAQLPFLEQPWLGHFAVADERDFRFTIDALGNFRILVLNKSGEPIEPYPITLEFLANETLPDGQVRDLPMNLSTIESTDPATAKLKKAVIRGRLTEQATGQPTLEVTIEIANGAILAGATVTDKGSFDKNPLKPIIRLGFPEFYAHERTQKESWDKKQIKDFDKLIGKDSVTLKHLDGKRVKLECVEKPDLDPAAINGGGISVAEIDFHAYQKRRIGLVAAPNSSVIIGNAGVKPLHENLWFQCTADPAKDPAGKAGLAIRIK
jgi:hypothetical protein